MYSDEALEDPYNAYMTFEDGFRHVLPAVVTDSHFAERDRMGRLVTFVARMHVEGFTDPVGVGVDERTALLIGPEGEEVVGRGAVYRVSGPAPESCAPGAPLEWADVTVRKTTRDADGTSTLSVVGGAFDQDPY